MMLPLLALWAFMFHPQQNASSGEPQQETSYFAPSVSPDGQHVAVFRNEAPGIEEYPNGCLHIYGVQASSLILLSDNKNICELWPFAASAWLDNSTVLLVGEGGILQFDIRTSTARPAVRGHFDGLALSHDRKHLATWRNTCCRDNLQMYELKSSGWRLSRQWTVSRGYDGDPFPQAAIFDSRDRFLYFQNLYEDAGTPIRKFSVSGNAHRKIVVLNAIAIADVQGYLYAMTLRHEGTDLKSQVWRLSPRTAKVSVGASTSLVGGSKTLIAEDGVGKMNYILRPTAAGLAVTMQISDGCSALAAFPDGDWLWQKSEDLLKSPSCQ